MYGKHYIEARGKLTTIFMESKLEIGTMCKSKKIQINSKLKILCFFSFSKNKKINQILTAAHCALAKAEGYRL